MSFQILLHPKSNETLKSYEERLQKRMKQKIHSLRDLANSGKPLEGTKFFFLRIGDYQVIYEIKAEQIHIIILFIGHRSVVYDIFLKWLS